MNGRPDTNNTVMQTLMKRHGRWMMPVMEPRYLFLGEWFGHHWGAGFAEDRSEILEILESMVEAVRSDQRDSDDPEVDEDYDARAAASLDKFFEDMKEK